MKAADDPSIAMFVHKLDRRAICQLVVEVCAELLDLGSSPILVAAKEDPACRSTLPDELEIEVLDAPVDRTTFAIPALTSFLRRRAPGVLFAHHNGPARAAVMARMLSRSATRVVTVEHNHYSSYISPTGGGHSYAPLRDLLTRWLYGRADYVAGVAPGIVDDLVSRFDGGSWATAVLPDPGRSPGVIERLAREPVDHPWYERRVGEPPRLICSVANVIPRKGQRTLVEALPRVRDRVGDVRLVLVGRRDNPEYAGRLEERADALGVGEAVDLVGFRANPVPWMAGADVFALASFNEGCPRVLSEAMACGVPVVAADCPSGPSFITDGGRAGLLVPPGDAEATAGEIVRVLTDAPLRRSLVERGLERSRAFSPRAIARRYLAVARECSGSTSAFRGIVDPALG